MSDWYAIRAATRQELHAAEALAERGFLTYLPMQTRWRITPRSKDPIDRPLFDGYLFVLCDGEDFRTILETAGVHQFVRRINRAGEAVPMPIPAFAIEGVMAEEWAGCFDYTRPSRRERLIAERRAHGYKKGERIMVSDGFCAGFMVTVLNMTNGNRSVRVDGPFGGVITLDVDCLEAA